MIYVSSWNIFGIFPTGKTKLESNKEGRKVISMAIWFATSWDFVAMEIKRPRLKATSVTPLSQAAGPRWRLLFVLGR